ncbi:MAG: hypothetical protein ACLP0B_09865 [Steroidobacteraceae bacterium]|jgi:hypothetical protein
MSDGTIKPWNPETARTGPGTPAVKHTLVPRGRVVRPFTYGDGQAGEGTPRGRENTSAKSQHYTHADAAEHRERERSQPYPGKR